MKITCFLLVVAIAVTAVNSQSNYHYRNYNGYGGQDYSDGYGRPDYGDSYGRQDLGDRGFRDIGDNYGRRDFGDGGRRDFGDSNRFYDRSSYGFYRRPMYRPPMYRPPMYGPPIVFY